MKEVRHNSAKDASGLRDRSQRRFSSVSFPSISMLPGRAFDPNTLAVALQKCELYITVQRFDFTTPPFIIRSLLTLLACRVLVLRNPTRQSELDRIEYSTLA